MLDRNPLRRFTAGLEQKVTPQGDAPVVMGLALVWTADEGEMPWPLSVPFPPLIVEEQEEN